MTNSPPHQGLIVSLQVGKPEVIVRPDEQSWTTGIIKRRVDGQVRLETFNLDGDAQADLVHHGGTDKAVCAYSADHYPLWRQVLHVEDFQFGSFGENFTIGGLTEADVCIGDTWTVGDASIQVSQPRQPCWKLARRWNIKNLAARVQQTGRTGWYFRVLQEGNVEAGLEITLVQRPHADWTVAVANQIMHHDKLDHERARQLASLPTLSSSWRKTLTERVKGGKQPNEARRLEGE